MEAFIHVTGNVGSGVEVRREGGVAFFRLACTPRVRNGDIWGDGHTTWITVTCFRQLAEHVVQSIRKGDPVVVVGKLRTSVWERDGQSYERMGIEASTVGHDLARGTATFTRRERPAAPVEDDVEPAADQAA